MHTRLIPFVRAAATVAVVAGTMFASAASAQVCPYNSTQGTCACPTSGAGTTCFGGQLFRSSDNSCQNDARPCAANQNWNCSTTSCVCNTASYPCGGCTAASSTVGQTCSAPAGGQYTNVCGACACPAGTTICSTSNTCVANRVCPQGTTWDPCTDTCGTPNVLLSPGWVQSGYIQVNGDVKSTAGNLRMDSATAAGQGDIYVANGKAIRVDGPGVTNINIGNWGVGGTGVDMNFPATSRLCFGATCRNSWPSTTDFNPTYVNATGDTITGDLNLTGATTDLTVAGNLGVGTATPGSKLDVQLNVAGSSGVNFRNLSNGAGAATFVRVGNDTDNISGLYRNSSANITDYAGANSLNLVNTGAYPLGFVTGATTRMIITAAGSVGIGTMAPTSALDVNGTTTMTGFRLTTGAANGLVLMSDASGNGTWQASPGISGSGTANYLPKFTAAATIGNSQLFDNGTNVGVGTTSPTALMHLNGNGTQLRVSAPTGGPQIELNRSSTSYRNSIIYQTGANNDFEVGISQADNGYTIRKITSQPLTGYNSFHVSGTGSGYVGINTVTPTAQLDVAGEENITSSAAGGNALTVTKSGAGNANGIYVTTAAAGNAMAALRAENLGAGRGLEVTGGTGSVAAHIKGKGNNYALDASVYDHSSPNTLELVMQIRRGTSGVAAVGMGGSIDFPLEGTDGSFYGGTRIGSVIASTSPWKTDFVVHPSSYSGGEQMRLTGDGNLGIGTAAPGAKLHVNGTARVDAGSGAGSAGLTVNGSSGTWAPSVGVSNGSQEWRMASWSDNSFILTKVTGSTFTPFRVANNSFNNALTVGASGVGINTGSAAVNLAVGGAGANVYATDAWIENNMHVQGNETVGSGRGRLRVGTAWNVPGIYAENNSVGQPSDLILGASSDVVQINAGTFGRPNNAAWLALWGSRIGDVGSGVLSLRSGGGAVAFDGGDYVGIGTASPAAALHVANGDTGYTTANYRRSIQVGPESYGSGVITWPWDGSGRWGIFGNGGDLRISRTYWNGSYGEETPTYHVFLTSAGDMGVGTNTSSVTAKLDVNGDTRVRGNIWSDGNWWDGGSGWIYCGGGGDCACPNGMWVGRVWNSGQYIACYGL